MMGGRCSKWMSDVYQDGNNTALLDFLGQMKKSNKIRDEDGDGVRQYCTRAAAAIHAKRLKKKTTREGGEKNEIEASLSLRGM